MFIDDVKRLSPAARFWYWCRERHQVYLRRCRGKPKPWTDDEVMRTVFFTNPYRENDKVTRWFREYIRGPLADDPRVLFATVAFRWFNLPATALVLMDVSPGGEPDWDAPGNLLTNWDPEAALYRLGRRRADGDTIFTGAFIINSPPGEPKLEAIVRRVNNVWRHRQDFENMYALHQVYADPPISMQSVHAHLREFDGMGGFMAYEVVCDLRYTYMLRYATDRMTWCNPGPGCIRGLYRLAGETWPGKGDNAHSPPLPKDWTERMTGLLAESRRRLGPMPPFEMREVEHSLCEWDKYERVLWNDGKPKRHYNGG